MTSTISDEAGTPETAADKLASCMGWLVPFGAIGILATVLAANQCAKWSEREALRRRHEAMAAQLEQIKQGEIHCFVQPEPDFIDELAADADCSANVEEIYLGGDVSDARLGRLRELPNLKCVVLLFAENADVFLERLQGMDSIETLNLEHTPTTRRGIEFINSLPKLKSLSLYLGDDQLDDLEGIKNHASIENLTISCRRCDDRLFPVLQSLPRLHSLTIEDAESNAKAFGESLRKALPDCECSVESGK